MPDGERLHLHHGPIDLIISAEGSDRETAYDQATQRFQSILTGLTVELDQLRERYLDQRFSDPVASRMANAVAPFAKDHFVTPMAAVAGAVAEEILAATVKGCALTKAYVNNGGDIAFHLTQGQTVCAAGPSGPIEITFADPVRGMATSGWRGRSHSLGIADAVTVVAEGAAAADVAATLVANAVDLPGHPSIRRAPATDIEIANELGDLMVTTDVGPLTPDEANQALDRGVTLARDFLTRGLIHGAVLLLCDQTRTLTAQNLVADDIR